MFTLSINMDIFSIVETKKVSFQFGFEVWELEMIFVLSTFLNTFCFYAFLFEKAFVFFIYLLFTMTLHYDCAKKERERGEGVKREGGGKSEGRKRKEK